MNDQTSWGCRHQAMASSGKASEPCELRGNPEVGSVIKVKMSQGKNLSSTGSSWWSLLTDTGTFEACKKCLISMK